jgi:hypothetical protein
MSYRRWSISEVRVRTGRVEAEVFGASLALKPAVRVRGCVDLQVWEPWK